MDDVYRSYLQEIAKYKPLSVEEQDNLIIKVKEGDKDAYEKLFHGNLKLVVFCAKKYFNYNSSFSKMDIVQEGNLGLIKAIEKYDLSYIGKQKFSSYAYLCIHTYILRAINDKGYLIRIPVHKHKELRLYDECLNKLTCELQRTPTIEELIDALHMTKENVLELSNLRDKIYLGSLNQTVYEDNDDEHISMIKDNEPDILDGIIDEENKEEAMYLLDKLTEREKKVLYYKYGFDNGIPKKYQEVSKLMHLSDRRYAFEMEKKALIKLRRFTKEHRKFRNN